MLSAHAQSAFCRKEEFTCGDNQCIEEQYRCNKIKDCRDGSDEVNCDGKMRKIICLHLTLYLFSSMLLFT